MTVDLAMWVYRNEQSEQRAEANRTNSSFWRKRRNSATHPGEMPVVRIFGNLGTSGNSVNYLIVSCLRWYDEHGARRMPHNCLSDAS